MAESLAMFRVDASPAIGGGHVMRCLTLARVLAAEGWVCRFAVRPPTLATVPALAAAGFPVYDIGGEAAAEPGRLKDLADGGCDLLVVDHYGWGAEHERACRSFARRILVIDDLADRPHDCDLLLDQNLGRTVADYDGLVPSHAKRLIGPSYALLRPEFAAARARALGRRRTTERVGRILVAMGLTDPANATSAALDALARIPDVTAGRIEVRAVLGSSAPHRQAVESRLGTVGPDARLLIDPADLVEEMVAADLCIGAGGSSSWERCCLGLPTVIVVVAENQRPGAEALAQAGAAQLAACASGPICDAVATAIASPALARAMGTRAAVLVDGLGARRVLQALSPARDRSGVVVALRPAAPDDLDLTFGWQNSPGVRRFSRTPNSPSREEHAAWFRRRFAEPAGPFNIVTRANEPCGILRLDRCPSRRGNEVSILIAPGFQGQGVARTALVEAARMMPGEDLVAAVLVENEASHRLFLSAGFELEDVGADGFRWYRLKTSEPRRTVNTLEPDE